tara:strand:- start:841 stop:1047 length:207 start_codon:yes stop_codon:yes gene_type:complete
MRYYYCKNCEKCVETDANLNCSNECGKSFLPDYIPSKEINMRKTWSGQTKVEFNTTTMDKDIAQRNKR